MFYTGYTKNLRRRFTEHYLGKSKSTRYRQPVKLVYYEAYLSSKDARRREDMLKLHKKGFSMLKKRITHSLL
ncbi:GIY-YIG nuclease family protein [Patescibacteria group bacterium]|nr:GIY-YIG nuclease family protein [Patescibacteria group bacterium]MBU1890135.1 GIY-YIG nuclease family protein [Patescibacteria group bacterium]